MKSTNKTQKRSEASKIEWKAVFAGETQVTPVLFNPTADQVRTIKNLPEDMEISENTYKRDIKDDEFSVVSLLCKYNPNELLELEEDKYPKEMFVNYDILCKAEFVKGSKSGKYQIIDEHNQSAWVAIKGKQSVKKAVEDAVASGDLNDYDPLHKIDADTARKAMVGEVALYQLIFNMSTLDPHVPDKDMNLDEFKLGEDPTETFKNICDGDVSMLNALMAFNTESKSENREFFMVKGEQNKLGVFLGVNVNKNNPDKMYQSVMTAPTHVNVTYTSTFRPTDAKRERSDFDDLGKTRMPKEALKVLMDEEYPWQAEWGNTLHFKEIKSSDIKANNTSIDSDSDDDDDDDDLPF